MSFGSCLLTSRAKYSWLKLPGNRVWLAETDHNGGEDSLGAEDEAVDQEGDEEDDPAPTSLRVIVLLQRPQLPQFLLVRRVLGPRDLAIAGDDHLNKTFLI